MTIKLKSPLSTVLSCSVVRYVRLPGNRHDRRGKIWIIDPIWILVVPILDEPQRQHQQREPFGYTVANRCHNAWEFVYCPKKRATIIHHGQFYLHVYRVRVYIATYVSTYLPRSSVARSTSSLAEYTSPNMDALSICVFFFFYLFFLLSYQQFQEQEKNCTQLRNCGSIDRSIDSLNPFRNTLVYWSSSDSWSNVRLVLIFVRSFFDIPWVYPFLLAFFCHLRFLCSSSLGHLIGLRGSRNEARAKRECIIRRATLYSSSFCFSLVSRMNVIY